MLIFQSDNVVVQAEGKIEIIPRKIHLVKTLSTNGRVNRTKRRVVNDYDVFITKMIDTEYSKFLDIFAYENEFSITDTEKGIYAQNYGIDGEEFKLDEVENKNDKDFYYIGNFRAERY